MSDYRNAVGRILSIICNILLLLFGVIMFFNVFDKSGKALIEITGFVAKALAFIVAAFLVGTSILGFISIFIEIPWPPLNYVSPVVGVGLAVLLLFQATKEGGNDIQILYVSLACLNLLNPVSFFLIAQSEGREPF